MAGQTIPTEEVSDIFFSRTPLVISTADSIKNFAEANTHDLEGYLKLTSALSGFLSIPVGMTQMGSSITTSMYGDVKIGNYSVEKVSRLATQVGGGLGALSGVAGAGLYFVELRDEGYSPGQVSLGGTIGGVTGVVAVVIGGAAIFLAPEVVAGLAIYELIATAISVVAFLKNDANYKVDDAIKFLEDFFSSPDAATKAAKLGSFADDALYGGSGKDIIYAGDGNDILSGGQEEDILYGDAGDDVLMGTDGYGNDDGVSDKLYGGQDFDTYIAGNQDIIIDSDGKGRVYFEGKLLTGGTKDAGEGCATQPDGSEVYKGDGGTYTLKGSNLTFTKDGKILTFNDYIKNDLSITLKDNEGDGGACPSPTPDAPCPKPVNPLFNFNFSLPSPTRSVGGGGGGGGGSYGGGGGGGSYYYAPSTPHRTPTPPIPVVDCVNEQTRSSTGIGGGGGATSPIVLDLNRDGITSISLAASKALFDYDGDGVLENTAWTQRTDALLVNDVNNDGLINNASELFGNYTKNSDGSIAKSGYQALSYYDTNSDGVVDATDTRFNELKLWMDANGDGATDAGELKTLTEMGVTSLALNNPATPYIPTAEETNTIIEETTFTDAQGEGIMRDLLFRYENNSTNKAGVYFDMDANGIKEKMTTWTDPNQWMVVKDINGDGKITSGKEVVGNNMILNNGTKAADTIQALKTFDINHDGKITTADNSGLAFWTDRNHNGLTDIGELEALGAAGAIQVIKLNPYQTLLSGYDANKDGVINGSDAVSNYLYIQTNADQSVTLYLPDNALAREMIAGYTGGESIQTAQGEKIIKTIQFYSGYEMSLNDELNGTDGSETLEGNSRSETLRGLGGRDILDSGAGNDTLEGGRESDKLIGGAGNDTYLYTRGDGKDLIIDSTGTDTIRFAEGITRDDLIIKSNGVDISIYLKDGSKPLTQLTDQIIIKDWHTAGTIETLMFSDSTVMDERDIVMMFATDKNDTIYGTESSETLGGGKGNDVLQGRGGSDTYVFGRGDGKDTVIDSGGLDTLQFGAGVAKGDLVVRTVSGSKDLQIGISEVGKGFGEFKDVITIKNWMSPENRIEQFTLFDGMTVKLNEISVGTDGRDYLVFGDIDTTVDALGGDDTIISGSGNDTLNGGAGNDTIISGSGNDTISGDAGADVLRGEEDDDILSGGTENDTLEGGLGNDTYIFGRGDGKDLVLDYAISGNYQIDAGNDTLKFGEGITKDNLIVRFTSGSDDLQIGISEVGKTFDQLSDVITVRGWRNTLQRVENFRLSDGTVVSLSEIGRATIGDDYLVFDDESTTIDGLAGNDTLIMGDGNDTARGGDGNDTILTAKGDDTLSGGKGTDTLKGGIGNDIYLFSRGDGADTFFDELGSDTLSFGEGITKDDLIFKQKGFDLIVMLKEAGKTAGQLTDTITLTKWFSDNPIEAFSFADGSTWTNSEIAAKLVNINIQDTLFSKASSVMRGGESNDTYVYNQGDFTVVVDDQYFKNNIEIDAGHDKLVFASGINRSNVTIGVNGVNLVLKIQSISTNEQLQDIVVIKDWKNPLRGIEEIIFSDGETLIIDKTATYPAITLSTAWTNNRYYIYGNDNDTVTGTNYDEVFETNGGDDTVNAGSGNDRIYAGEGNDTIEGGAGNDTIVMGSGDDYVTDASGDDIYLFSRGDGKDIVNDTAGNDMVVFGEGIVANDLILQQYGNDLVVGIKDDLKSFYNLSDKLTIKNWFIANNRIETFKFSDNSTLGIDAIVSRIATDEDDVMNGIDSRNDTLSSGKGNDTLNGLDGDDTLNGGVGNDILNGGNGNDAYLFGRGDGNDVVTDTAGLDRIRLGEGIGQNDLRIERIGNDLLISVLEVGDASIVTDTVTFKDWSDINKRIEIIELFDGTKIQPEDILPFTDGIESYSFGSEDNVIHALGGNDTIVAGDGNDTVHGEAGNDTLWGHYGQDTLKGGDGDDVLYGDYEYTSYGYTQGYADTLEGGKGNDTLKGGSGNDIYIFNRGDGKDYIYDNYHPTGNWANAGNDTLKFGEGITVNDLILKQNGNQLIVALKEDGKTFDQLSDKITLEDWTNSNIYHSEGPLGYNAYFGIENFTFADGSTWVTADIMAHIGTDANDVIYGLYGADTINGGKGNDTLYGREGDDIYVFNRGDGQDVIYDFNAYYGKYNYNNGGNDTLKLGEGIVATDLIIQKSGNNVIVALKEEGVEFIALKDKVTLQDWYNVNNRIEKFVLSDGTVIDTAFLFDPTENDDSLIFGVEDNVIHALGGNDTIVAGDGNDTVHGEAGNDTLWRHYGQDTLKGGDGDDVLYGDYEYTSYGYTQGYADTLEGGKGNDTLKGGSGNDIYIFNRGDGKDYIYDNYYFQQYYGLRNAGNDTLKFGEGITANDLILKQNGNQLIVALIEDGKTFDQLSDVITLENWSYNTTAYSESYSNGNYNAYFGIENFTFADGSTWVTADIMAHIGTDANDVIYGLDGADTIHGGQGDDTLYGRVGDDTYVFNRGDGKDTIFDDYGTNVGDNNSGNDTLKLGEGIVATDLIIQKSGNNVIVALKEEGVEFIALKDKVTLQDWYNVNNRIEKFILSDGTAIDTAFLFDPTENDDNLTFGAEDNVIHALGGNDTILAGAGNDTIYGEAGNDNLQGQDGNDTIDGGEGNDTLNGASGNDTYLFGIGDGKDTVNDSAGNDTLRFKEGITVNDILLKQVENNLVIGLKEEGKTFDQLSDVITLKNWSYNTTVRYETYASYGNYNAYYGIENFTFSDGSTWATADIMAHIGTDVNDVIYGLDGADTINGGKGDDTLYGRVGDDTYVFNRGDGKDTIFDDYGIYTGDYNSGNDTLKLGEGITADDLIIQKSGNDVIVAIKEDGVEFANLTDKVTLKDWYNVNNRIEKFILSDGTAIDTAFLFDPTENDDNLTFGAEDNVIHALGGNDTILAGAGNDTIYGEAGNDNLQGQDGNDTFYGGDGNDTLYGQAGDDVIDGGAGNDSLQGSDGNDTYLFGRGDGKDTVLENDFSNWNTTGNDTLRFKEGITAADILIKQIGDNLVIGLKEEGKTFAQLSDVITLENWSYNASNYPESWGEYNTYYGVENFTFSDGTTWATADIISHIGTDENDVIYGLDGADTIDGGKGDDTLYGRVGDDTYLFNRGDGKDTVFDAYYYGSGGNDTLKLGSDIDKNSVVFLMSGGNLIVDTGNGDTVTIQSQTTANNRIETIVSSDAAYMTYIDIERVVQDAQIYATENGIAFTADNIRANTHLMSIMSSLWHTELVQEYQPPIVFDLNGNGITSTSTEGNTVYFDYNADGLRERTGWAERGDALLAVDVNHDGIINDGSELFGDQTKLPDGSVATDGYEAMKQYDSNNDGKIDVSDAKFNDLLLWKDTNLDGQSSVDELSTLAENGIVSIDLAPNAINVSENGNRISYETSFSMASGVNGIVRDLWFKTAGDDTIASTAGEIAETGSFSDSFDDFITDTTLEIDSIKSFADSGVGSLTLQSRYTGSGLDGASAQTVFEGVGYTGTLSNVWLTSDTLDTQYTYNGTLSDDVKALPSIDGQGNVINLQEAMNEKSGLASSVTEFQNLSETGNLADFEANIDAIIEGWALYDLSGESVNSTPPIVLDLDGDGVTSTSLGTSSAYFDYDGDGRREHTAWADAGDALLAVDLDNDGVITHGAELFGDYTLKADATKATDGYDAMAQYDTNDDNVLDASDAQFSKLKLWKDLNQNGKNDVGELSTLTENGISAINLSRTDGTTFTQITEAGNTITNETNYTASSGEGVVRDVWFSYDGTDTIAYSNLSDSDEKKIAIVENFYGRRLNSEERNSVEVIAEVLNQYNALRYDTIAKIITDKLYGEGFPNCQFLHDALNNTLGRVVGGLASTTETLLAVNLLGALLKREHVGVLADIYPEYFSNSTIAGLLAQSNIAIGFEDGALIGHIGNRYFGTSSAETLDFSTLDGVRAYMSGGDDTIIGSKGIDEIVGGEGNDVLDGNSGNDVLEGGQGDDVLKGASTQNVYRYAWGDGNDTIIDAGSDEYAPDTLRFSNLDISRVSIERLGDDMIIHVRDEEGELLTPFGDAFGTVTIKDGYAAGKIEHFYFKDARYTFDEVLAYVPADTNYYFVKADGQVIIDEKGGDDTLHFGEGITKESIIARIVGNDLIIGLAQEGRTFDTLSDKMTILNYTGAIEHFKFDDGSMMELSEMVEFAQAHLKITGSSESETLYGTNEGEMFNAGAGDDSIYGEGGDDTYTFGLADGSDTIVDTAGNDTILLKDGVLASDVTLSLDGDDLLVSLNDGSRMRVVSWISSEGRIEHIKDTEGESVDFSAVLKPVVENTTLDGEEDTPFEGSLSVVDISGTPLIYAVATDPQNGTFALDTASGGWIYKPNANYNGSDSVVVSVTNGYGVTSTSTITLNVAGVNDAPIIEGDDITVMLRNILTTEGNINALDVDGDTLVYTIETQASHGTLSVDEQGKWFYTTIDGYDGQDSAVIRVSDGNGGSIDRVLSFTIIDNTAPDAPIETTNTLQDIRILTGEVGATDIDGDVLTYTVSTAATYGVLSVDETGVWSYSASEGYMGTDSAIVTIDDNNGGIITQTLNFDVKISAPTLADAVSNLLEDNTSNGAFNVVNPIGGVLTYEVLSATANGTFNVDANGNWSYNPSQDYNGTDSVLVKVTNEYGLSTTATLNLAIEAVNDAPVTTETESFILQDVREQAGTVEATDVDGDILSYSVTTAAEHGTLAIDENGAWTYNVNDLYMGIDTAIITVDDGMGGTATKTLTFDAKVTTPTLADATSNLLEDNTSNGVFNVVNPIGGVLTYEVLSATANGTFNVDANGNWSYNPSQDYNGTDSVLVKVTNEYGLSTTATLNLAIEAVNDAPVTTAEASFTLQDIRIQAGTVEASDIENDTLTYSVSTAATHGTLTINESGVWSYSATEGYMGIDTAVITVDDGNGGTATQTLTFDLKVSAPHLDDVNAMMLEDSSITGTLNVLNPIGGALSYEIISASIKGNFTVNAAGECVYTPAANANGNDSVIVKVTNAYGLSTTAILNVAIEAVNDAPIVVSPVILNAVDEDSGVITITKAQLLANAGDVDGDILDVLTLSASTGVLVDNLDGTWSLTPAANYHGTIDLNYIVTDGQLNVITSAAQVVLSVNDAPILIQIPSAVTLDAGTSAIGNILASDIDGDILSYSVATVPEHGTLAIDNNGAWNYTAERYYAGQTSATINVNDGQGGSVATTLNFANLMTPDWQYAYSGNAMTINDSDGIDALMMSNISMADLTFLQEGNNLRLDVKGKEDVILTDYFTSLPKGVESIQAKEGPINLVKQKLGKTGQFFSSIWGGSQGDLISGTTSSETISGDSGNDILFGGLGNDTLNGENDNDLLIGGEGSDTLNGGNNNDIIYGDAGNDSLNGDSGDDKLFGGLGNDTLNGDEGNDLLSGAEGTNTLKGGDGNDTYLFTKGANTTTIEDKSASGFFFFGAWCSNDAGNDTVKFGEGVTKNDISFLMNGHDLVLQYGTGELMTVKNQDNNDMKIEKFELNDGSYLTNIDMDQIIQQLTAYKADNAISITNNDQLRQNQAMMNIIASGWHQ